MKNPLRDICRNPREHNRDKLVCFGFHLGISVYLEILLHFLVYGDLFVGYPLLFGLASGSVTFLLTMLFPEKVNRLVGFLFITLIVFYYEVQLIYHGIFGTFMSISQAVMGTEAVTNFFSQTLHGIWSNLFSVLLLLIPIPVTAILYFRKILRPRRLRPVQIPMVLAFILGTGLCISGILQLTDTSNFSAYVLLTNPNTSTETSVRSVGLIATTIQETKGLFHAMDEDRESVSFAPVTPPTEGSEVDQSATESITTNRPDPEITGSNSLEIDFEALSNTTEDSALQEVDQYLSGTVPTKKNPYTGLARGYNVITVCAEAFSPLLIDKELTPTLYKLANNGLVFQNFYNSFPNTTTNGEYTFCTGLLPNMSRNKTDSSFNLSADNYLPYCLGNTLSELGYETLAYHNYYATFYDRHITHKNMGYDFRAVGQGLEIPLENPCSDLKMIQASVDDYVNSDRPFHVYYMTYSGHYQYNWNNAMSNKNKNAVADLPYSETTKAYIACNLELEYAMTALMEALEAAGKANSTMIVLSTDHYPYGLPDECYYELMGRRIDTPFEKFRNAFICYIPDIEPVQIDKYCSSIDILPTVLNLLGVEYDSRLLVGKDVLSDEAGIAILSDQSFLTDELSYNAADGTALTHDGSPVDPQTLQSLINDVANRFTLSNAILEQDYYAHVFSTMSPHQTDAIVNFTDIKDPYVESAATYMIEHGFMKPISQSEFGAEPQNSTREFLTVLYKIAGSPSVHPANGADAALTWAISVDIVSDASAWDTNVTYLTAAEMIYRFCSWMNGQEPSPDISVVAVRGLAYPELSEHQLRAYAWCIDKHRIITGSAANLPYEQPNQAVTRHQIVTYLHRMYMLLHN